MNRRGFLSLLGGTAAAMTLDPERALWTPGKKLISIPNPQVWHGNHYVTADWIANEALRILQHHLKAAETMNADIFEQFDHIGDAVVIPAPRRVLA